MHQNHPKDLQKFGLLGPLVENQKIQQVWGKAQESAFLMSSQGILTQQILEPTLKTTVSDHTSNLKLKAFRNIGPKISWGRKSSEAGII